MDGFIPFASMVSYQLSDYTTFFSAVGASSKDADGIRRESAGRTFIGTVAMGYKGRFFLWMITANDPQIFNELLHVHLQFAKDPPVALVPFELGQNDGKKKQVVPR